MSKTIVSIDAQATAPPDRFSAPVFTRLLRLCCRYPRSLLIGLLATLVFACLHTVSIGAALPVFKILLEEEQIHTWIDRTIAGRRIGAVFAPITKPEEVRLVHVDTDGPAYRQHLRAGDRLRDAKQRPAVALLRDLARAAPGQAVGVRVHDAGSGAPERSDIMLKPLAPDFSMRALRRAASLLPQDIERDKLRTLAYILAGLLIVIVLANVFRYIGEVWIAKAVLRAMMQLRTDLYERTLHLPMSFFAQRSTSDIVGRFVQDIQEIQRGMLTLFGKFIREPLRAFFLLGLAFVLDWRLTFAVVIVAPVAVFVFWRVGKRVKRSNRRLLQAWGEMIGALTTSLQSLRVVKTYTAEDRERDRLRQVDYRALRQQLKLAKLQALVSPTLETIAVVAACVVTLWLASQVLNHELPISQFGTLGLALTMLFDPLRRLSDVYVRVQRSTAGAERIFQVIDHPIETDGSRGNIELKPMEQAIEYVNVTFTYAGAETPALRNINLTIRRGETVAIVGPNGCGKTTLVSMLARLFDPDEGEIRYDGIDIREATLKSLRRQISLVSQEAVVFGGTPAENIAYGQPAPDEHRVREAARRAKAHEFIEAIPNGYAAELGERGTTLSGGQRQRLAIARAIFRDAPILIFDEATSQIDAESEVKIQAALRDFAKGRTTLIVAHRLSTIQFADRIIVMDAGEVIDDGTHEELFDRCDLYRTLCETQLVAQPAPG